MEQQEKQGNGVKMEKQENGVKAVEEDGVKKAVAGPEEGSLTAPEAAAAAACYKKAVGEEATFLYIAKDYLKQLKDTTAETHWACIKNRVRAAGEYVSQKSSSVFGKQKVEPEVKDETPEEAAKPAPAPVESH